MTGTAIGHLLEVAFKGNRKEFFLWEGERLPAVGAAVIVEADRGEDLGRVHSVGELAEHRCQGCAHGAAEERPARRMLRLATGEDTARESELRTQDDVARQRAIEKVRTHALVMKVSDAEWQWDRRKLTFYFTAEKRVDFRSLVRDLAAMFRTRIELKQIGVRDEAKRLDGVGRCGRQYCSSSWLPELRPVNLQVAKDQRLSLNPSQISGACGRLMCCLRYEHEFYVQARKRYPKEGKILATARGEEKVLSTDIFRERVTLLGSDGETRVILLAELKREMDAAGAPPSARADRADRAERTDGSSAPLRERRADTPRRSEDREEGEEGEAPTATGEEPPVGEGERPRRPRRRGRRGGRRGRSGGDRGETSSGQ